jgi:uncharacterized membrane-anchored protein
MTTATKPQTAAETPVGERTDKELTNRLNALIRARDTRMIRRDDLDHEIEEINVEHDAILDEQARRLSARRSKPIEAKETEQ